jgi:streptomycin 6-kinase
LPTNLVEAARQEGREEWLTTLPGVIRTVSQRWSLTVGAPFQPGGCTAWVAPARSAAGTDLVLKLGWRHPEAFREADGLRLWAGEGAARLYADLEFEETSAMLLERCVPGTELSSQPEPEQDGIIAGLLRRLWRIPPPGHPFLPLSAMCDQWATQFELGIATSAKEIDPGLAWLGSQLFRSLSQDADRSVLLCTDLHAGNVLAAEREPWLVIDPKPYVGDPAYDVIQHMLNCPRRLHADPRRLAASMAELLDLDVDRVLLWLFARCVIESPEWPALLDVARQLAPA